MKKRVLAILIPIVMFCQLLGGANVFGAQALADGYLASERFDGEAPSFAQSGVSLEHGIETKDGENVYKISSPEGSGEELGKLSYPMVYFAETEDVQVVSFDIMLDRKDFYGHIVLRSGGWSVIYSITSDGYIIADWNRQTKMSEGMNGFKYEAGQWYTLTAVINRADGAIELYKGSEGYGILSTAYELPANMSIVFERAQRWKIFSNTMYIDNIEIGTKEIFKSEKVSHLGIVCEELGQAFWGKAVSFGVKVTNTADTAKTYDVTAELVNDLGDVEFSESNTVELGAGESTVINYSAGLSRYAVYALNITSQEKATNETKQLNTELVTLKRSLMQNPKLGIVDHAADKNDGFGRHDEKYEYIKNMGMSAIRAETSWNLFELNPGEYKLPNRQKEAFESIKAHNMDLFLIAGFNNKTVTTANGLEDEMPPVSEKNIELFGKYTNEMADDTKNYAYGYDIWNEWNVPSFNVSQFSGAEYIPLIKEAYTGIKAANPEAKVYGLSGLTWNGERQETFKTMAAEMFENGVADYCDGFSVHTYGHEHSPDDGYSLGAIDYIRDLMQKNNAEDKELIITEMGWMEKKQSGETRYSAETIASWIVKYSAMVHDKVDRMYWYCAQRKVRNVGADEQSYGWMQDENRFKDYVPYAPLPQFRAMANYNSYIANTEKTGEVKVPENNAILHYFKRSNGTDVILAWVKDGEESATHTVELDTPYATVSDLYGNVTYYETEDGKLEVTLTNEPVYIAESFSENGDEPKALVMVMNDDSSVYVGGNIGLQNENLAIYVEKDGVPCYINQIKTDASGNYDIVFPLNKEYGVYNLTIGTKDNGKTPLTFEFSVKAFEFEVLKDGKPIDTLTDLQKGDKLTVKTANNIGADNASVIAAQYNAAGVMTDIKITPYSESDTMEIEVNEDIESMKIFVWNIVNVAPLIDEFPIEK